MSTPRLRIEAVLFDLDGTLVDTLPDITWSLNQVLLEHGCPALTAETVRDFIGGGTTAMIEAVATRFGIADAAMLHQRYVRVYQDHLVQFSRPFSGVLAMLEGCRELRLPLAIVTNKAEAMACQVADALLACTAFKAVLGHRAGRSLKPQPDVAWEAARRLSVDPRHCLFVGVPGKFGATFEAGVRTRYETLFANGRPRDQQERQGALWREWDAKVDAAYHPPAGRTPTGPSCGC